jgi:HSP20 family protein
MTAMTRWNDAPVMSLRDAFDRLFENAFTPVMGGGSGSPASGIAANVWETGDGYQVAMLMPGVNPEQITLTTLGNTITVEGSLELSQPEGARVVWQEFGPAQFRRQIGLPADVDADKVQAAYQNGILLLTAPKAEHAKPRTIKVNAA